MQFANACNTIFQRHISMNFDNLISCELYE